MAFDMSFHLIVIRRQFGNMLVLSATYHRDFLKNIIQRDRLQALLLRTISFLRRLIPISPTCSLDCMVLEAIQNTLFGVAKQDKHVYDGEAAEPRPIDE